MSNSQIRAHVSSPVHNGEVRCYRHPEVALRRIISRTQKNPNRAFYSCEVLLTDDGSAKCDFFKWEDQLQMPSPPPSQGASQSSPLTPSKRPASSLDHELSPVHKRLNTSRDAPTPSPRSAASKARLVAMLSAQGQPAQPEASTSTLPSSSLPNSTVSPSPASSYHTALSETSHSPLLPSWCPAKLTSAKPTTPLFSPVTPPPTAEHTERHSPNSAPEVKSPEAHKTPNDQSVSNGMRSSVLGASKGARLDDPFSPSGSYTRSGGSEPRGPVASHSRASADVEGLADSYMDFSVQIHSYMKTLEERVETAEKSNDAKAQKIECLQEEIERLKLRNEELESTLANLT